MSDYAAEYHYHRERDAKADALRNRQLQVQQQTFTKLQNRTDFVAQPGIVGTRDQSLQRIPVEGVQRLPVGEQIVRDPSLLKKAIMPTPMKAVPQPKSVSTRPYAPKVQQYPLKKVPSTLYTGGLQTGMPVKKWPTSFKKAFHKPTQDENILKGLRNLDSMSQSLLGKPGR
jgi:hypothetical protein